MGNRFLHGPVNNCTALDYSIEMEKSQSEGKCLTFNHRRFWPVKVFALTASFSTLGKKKVKCVVKHGEYVL